MGASYHLYCDDSELSVEKARAIQRAWTPGRLKTEGLGISSRNASVHVASRGASPLSFAVIPPIHTHP